MAEMDLNNKVAIVTGGARGIGLAISKDLLKEGVKVVIIVDIHPVQGMQTVASLNSKYGAEKTQFIKADVTLDLDDVYEEVVAKYKTIDILVNNAGIVDENDIRRTLNINVVATVEWTMKFLEHMRKDKGGAGGTILNISSLAGVITDPYIVFYKASKHAVLGFTKSLGHTKNYNVTGVRLLVLCPGYTRTDIIATIKPNNALPFHSDQVSSLTEDDWQNTDAVSKAAVEVFKNAESGTAWLIMGGKEVKEVPTAFKM